jgi:predicted nucleic acid-binding protein
MILPDIPEEEKILIDANIFIYANQGSSVQCMELLSKCSQNQLTGILPVHTLAEVIHVLMLAEAKDMGIIKRSNPAKQLSENPEKVKQLHRYEDLIRDLLSIGLKLEPLEREDILTAINLQHKYGLLTNDALFLAVAVRLRITSIVSADRVFSNIPGIYFYSPGDITL